MGLFDEGPEVLEVQKCLTQMKFNCGKIDGVYGFETENAVKSYQFENKLEITGKVDKDLYRNLLHKDLPSRFAGISGNITILRRLVAMALGLQGVPYVFGGTTPYGFDCSGFVQYVFRQLGFSLPRMADEQYNASARVSQLSLGNLVFFETYTSGVSHVGIYLGNRRFIHASSSKGVTISSLDDSYWSPRYVGAGKVF